MSDRKFIRDSDGEHVRNSDGDRLFYSTEDGDSPRDQKVYSEQPGFGGLGGGSTREDVKYDPEAGEFDE